MPPNNLGIFFISSLLFFSNTHMWQLEYGILTSSVRHNDKTCVARVFTQEHGMVPFIFHLAGTGKNAGRNTLLQPLTQLEFQAEFISGATLQHMKEVRNLHPYRDIPFNPAKSAISLFLSEFLTHALGGEQSNSGMFKYLTGALEWFDGASEGEYSNFHIALMLGTAYHLGICPNSDDWRPGYILDMREGLFTADRPAYSEYADAAQSLKLVQIMKSGLDGIKDAPLTGQQRVNMLNMLNSYFRLHIPSFPVLKSIEILEAVFRPSGSE